MSKSNNKKSEEVKPTKPAKPKTIYRLRFVAEKAPNRKAWLRSFGIGSALGAAVTGIVVGASVLTGASLSDLVTVGSE